MWFKPRPIVIRLCGRLEPKTRCCTLMCANPSPNDTVLCGTPYTYLAWSCFQIIIYLVGLFFRFCKIGLRFILGLVLISDRISEVSLSGSSDLEATEDDPLSGVLRSAAEGCARRRGFTIFRSSSKSYSSSLADG